MKTYKAIMASALALLMFGSACPAFAATTTGATQNTRFEARYQSNLKTETTLLQKAQQINNAHTANYAQFVTTVSAQVDTLYASEQALVQLGFTWGQAIRGNAYTGVIKQEKAFQAQLKKLTLEEEKHKAKNRQEILKIAKIRREIAMVKSEMNRINKLELSLKPLLVINESRYFDSNVSMLQRSILGLQQDEIRVTKTWIASGNTSVTGSVYSSQDSSTSSTTLAATTSN